MVCHHTDLGRTVDDRLWIAARGRLIINALPRLSFDELDQIPSNTPYKDVIKITIAMCNVQSILSHFSTSQNSFELIRKRYSLFHSFTISLRYFTLYEVREIQSRSRINLRRLKRLHELFLKAINDPEEYEL